MTRKLNQLTCITDMGRLPWSVHLGASLNIVFTIWLTSLVHTKIGGELLYLPLFALMMIALNLIPVVFLRIKSQDKTSYPEVSKMNFFGDQHRFSTWVYAVASGNMFFWITVTWCVFSYNSTSSMILVIQLLSFIITYVPLWRNFIKE